MVPLIKRTVIAVAETMAMTRAKYKYLLMACLDIEGGADLLIIYHHLVPIGVVHARGLEARRIDDVDVLMAVR